MHAALYLLTAVLLVSGVALVGEGIPRLEALFGGHVATSRWHRWIGYGLVAGAGAVLALRPRASARFVGESARFRAHDLRWFARYPAFLLRPGRNVPERHEGHFDPGQRLFNLLALGLLLALSVSGVLMSFPEAFTRGTFVWSLRVHRVATWALGLTVAGHVLVASGVLRAYRGTWRAMHGDGRVAGPLADRLWPRWADEQERGRIGGDPAPRP